MSSEPIERLSPEAAAEWRAAITPEYLAALDAMTENDIAAQIAANPDAAPDLDKAWFHEAFAWTEMRRSAGLIDAPPTRAEIEVFEHECAGHIRDSLPQAAE